MKYGVLALLALIGATGSAQASVISGIISGTIDKGIGTDPLGLFGPAGTNLAGKAISLSFSYDTTYFSSAVPCGANCNRYVDSTSDTVPLSASASVTINGVTQAYNPSTMTTLNFFNETPSKFSANLDGFQGKRGIFFQINSSDIAAFGQPINPKTSFLVGVSLFGAGDIDTFFATASPEPNSVLLILSGLVTLGLKKRFHKNI